MKTHHNIYKSTQIENKHDRYWVGQRAAASHKIGDDYLFSRMEFAAAICVYPTTLRYWEKQGKLVPDYKDSLNGKVWYSHKQFEAYQKAKKKWKHTETKL